MMFSSPHGRYPVASWRCERCDGGSGEHLAEAGRSGEHAADLRDEAIAHLKLTGHDVSFWRGTREDLIALHTEAPGDPHRAAGRLSLELRRR